MLTAPLQFVPVYQSVIWGGRRMEQWRNNLPAGPIGESWDLADHERGMSVVAHGPLQGKTLRELSRAYGAELVGPSYNGGDFPLMIKLIDAQDRLSIQVHPDDAGSPNGRGKTECWYLLNSGGSLYVGTRPGINKQLFSDAREHGTLAQTLNQFTTTTGDFFFIPARTVHALGAGCLMYEIQQTCDITYRVDDWGRLGMDGKPRPLHIAESLSTIDFTAQTQWSAAHQRSQATINKLATCNYFSLHEIRAAQFQAHIPNVSVVICLSGNGTLSTAGGTVALKPMTTTVVPAAAGAWTARAEKGELKLLWAHG
jgi:mannose-6-phosphate isomerase